MSEPVIRHRPARTADDFERRTKQGAPAAGNNDPLAELARLVGEPYDPLKDVFGREPYESRAETSQYGGQYSTRRRDYDRAEEASPRLFGDFAAIEAGLRGAVAPENEAPAQIAAYQSSNYGRRGLAREAEHATDHHTQVDYGVVEPAADTSAYAWDDKHAMQPEAESAEPSSSKKPMYLMAAAIAVGIVGIGGAYALKGRLGSSPREIKTITADASPTKVQPPSDATNDTANQNTVTATGNSSQSADALVDRKEQPVDLKQAVQDNSDVSRLLPGSVPGNITDAASVAVPPSPGQVRTAMADPNDAKAAAPQGEQANGFGLPDLPSPKRVRVVSVRPDGTIMPDRQDTPASAAGNTATTSQSAAEPTDSGAAPVAAPKPTSPRTAASKAQAAKAKTTARATAKKKISAAPPRSADDINAAAAPDAGPAAAGGQGASTRVASAEAEPAQDATEAGVASGGFAVQLAAASTEAEAKATSARLGKKFAGALAGHKLGFRHADINGHSVYRLRVSSLGRADAVSLCEKVKAEGGTCFVAKN